MQEKGSRQGLRGLGMAESGQGDEAEIMDVAFPVGKRGGSCRYSKGAY